VTTSAKRGTPGGNSRPSFVPLLDNGWRACRRRSYVDLDSEQASSSRRRPQGRGSAQRRAPRLRCIGVKPSRKRRSGRQAFLYILPHIVLIAAAHGDMVWLVRQVPNAPPLPTLLLARACASMIIGFGRQLGVPIKIRCRFLANHARR